MVLLVCQIQVFNITRFIDPLAASMEATAGAPYYSTTNNNGAWASTPDMMPGLGWSAHKVLA